MAKKRGKLAELSRRERQIMDFLFARKEADVQDIQAALPDAPEDLAGVRKLLSILEDKGHVTRRKEGRRFIYSPRQDTKRAGASAMQHLLKTFFGGSVEEAMAAHLSNPKTKLSDNQLASLVDMIDEERARRNKK